MTTPPTRRSVLVVLASAPIAGCLGAADDSPDDTQTTEPADQQMTDSDELLSVEQRQQQVEQLPETSPLVGSLVDLVKAEDRRAAADDHGIEYDDTNHTARVAIELEPDGELPDGYRLDTISSYEGHVVANVHVDDLVPLAMDDAVRRVGKPPESRTTK
jgi:hypothetical protein